MHPRHIKGGQLYSSLKYRDKFVRYCCCHWALPSMSASGFDAGVDEGRFSLSAPPCWRIPPVNRRQLQLIIMMMEQRYRRAGCDVIPVASVAGDDHRRFGSQGGEKFASAMELGKTATHRQVILLCRHDQSIASAAWWDLEPGGNHVTN